MAKFSGKIGYVETEETSPGIWSEKTTERQYYGDLVRSLNRWAPNESIGDNISFGQDISIVADPYMYGHLKNMRYVSFKGAKWEINSFEVERPRVRIILGSVFNGD